MIFDIDRELEDEDTIEIKPCVTLLLLVSFLTIFYQLVGDKLGPEL